MTNELQQALTALEAGRLTDALDALLDAWRTNRSPELADVIDALGHAFPGPKLEGNAQSEWMALARKGEAADVFVLVETLLTAGPISALAGRVEQLVERPEDPRIALAFVKLAVEPPTTSSSNFPVWTKMFGCIEATGDARVIPLLKKRAGMKPGTSSQFWPKLNGWIERALKKLAAPSKLTKADAALVAKLARAAKNAKPVAAAKPSKPKPSAAPLGDPLARALTAAKSGDLPACVDALLDGWRERRLAAYAQAIDRVTALHDEGLPHPDGKDAWAALAANKRAIDVGRLADAAGDGKPADADQRLEEMLTWPDDPRIARAMFTHCEARTFSDRTRTWSLVADLLVKNIDVRLAPHLAAFAETGGENKARRAAMRRAGPAALAAIGAKPVEPVPAELASLKTLHDALTTWDEKRPVSERRLLEAIVAAPDDDAPALVYADWLIERGHPRGELITLQCAATPDPNKQNLLLRAQPRSIVGPAACLMYANLAYAAKRDLFRRGLLRKLELRNHMPTWFFEHHPLLWFLEELDPGDVDTTLAVVNSSRALRTLSAQPSLVVRLAALPTPLGVETLRLSYAREPETPLAALLQNLSGRGLSRVKHLEFFWSNGETHHDGIPDTLVASPLFENVETLAVATARLDTVLAALAKHGRSVAKLSLLRRHYLRFRLDVELDTTRTPRSVALLPERHAGELSDEEGEALVTALTSLKLPTKMKLTVADGLSLPKPTRTAVSKLVAL